LLKFDTSCVKRLHIHDKPHYTMHKKYRKYVRFYIIAILVCLVAFLFSLDLRDSHRFLTFAMLDIGQGDALFIESPTGTQVLVDGGPPRKILGHLAKVMPPFDRTLDAIVMTHPDADHISGFLDVLTIYQVGKIFEPGIATDSKIYHDIEKIAEEKNIPSILAKRGMRLNLGGGAVLDILFPDRDVYEWETNAGSIVAKLSYGDTSVMLTGDATIDTEKIILSENGADYLRSTVLKAGHHGSRTSSSKEFVKIVAPQYAFISAGKDNRYGHPHQEVLDILKEAHADILRTDVLGTIIMKSDGKKETFSFYK